MNIGRADSLCVLGYELLRVYEHLLRRRQAGAAEHTLRALEELARCSPACQPMLDEAYLLCVRSMNRAHARS